MQQASRSLIPEFGHDIDMNACDPDGTISEDSLV